MRGLGIAIAAMDEEPSDDRVEVECAGDLIPAIWIGTPDHPSTTLIL
jgi:hypothetical protein